MQRVKPQPFLKWVGGKRALLENIRPHIETWRELHPKGRYFEPFLGAGAVFFDLDPAVTRFGNDSNQDLIEVYSVIRDNPAGLLKELKKHKNEAEHFYKIRELDRKPEFASMSPEFRASRFIYLNRTCFNGLYRVNGDGYFNVPFGAYVSPNFINEENIFAVSEFLNRTSKVKLTAGDYRKCARKAKAGDFVYFDPPYAPISKTASFTAYVKDSFGEKEQAQLRDEAVQLVSKGVRVLLSNNNTELIRNLYSDKSVFKIELAAIHRGVGAKRSSRGQINELLISSI